jgi:hypothetical protein
MRHRPHPFGQTPPFQFENNVPARNPSSLLQPANINRVGAIQLCFAFLLDCIADRSSLAAAALLELVELLLLRVELALLLGERFLRPSRSA